MPSRWQCLLIIVFWLGATGWLFVRELEPNLHFHEPPPYAIDLTAETQIDTHPRVPWKVFLNGKSEETYHAKTWMDHREEDDSFALKAQVKPNPLASQATKATSPVDLLESEYRVSREGRLREFQVEGILNRRPVPGMPDLGFAPRFALRGIVLDDQILAHLSLPNFFGGLIPAYETNF